MEYRLDVERTLENRLKLNDWKDESPLAWEEHRRRAVILHELLDDDREWRVRDWGDTEDEERTHELVRLALGGFSRKVLGLLPTSHWISVRPRWQT